MPATKTMTRSMATTAPISHRMSSGSSSSKRGSEKSGGVRGPRSQRFARAASLTPQQSAHMPSTVFVTRPQCGQGELGASSRRRRARTFARSRLEDGHDLPDRIGRSLQHLPLVVREIDLEDLLDPPCAELDRDAHVVVVDAVLALEIRRAGEDALLVEAHRVDHLRGG